MYLTGNFGLLQKQWSVLGGQCPEAAVSGDRIVKAGMRSGKEITQAKLIVKVIEVHPNNAA